MYVRNSFVWIIFILTLFNWKNINKTIYVLLINNIYLKISMELEKEIFPGKTLAHLVEEVYNKHKSDGLWIYF